MKKNQSKRDLVSISRKVVAKGCSKLNPMDSVFIDPMHGWHYHRKECFMAGEKAILFKDIDMWKPIIGKHYLPCSCIYGLDKIVQRNSKGRKIQL